jgi:hypothetical protein
MRASTAYFVGAGTVIAAIVVGLGGGLLMANIVSPNSPRNGTEMTRLEQRMSTRPIPVITGPSEPVPYLTATQPAATNPVVVAPADQAQPEHAQQTQAANTASPPQQPTEATAARDTTASQSASSNSAQSSAPAAQPVAGEQAASPQDAVARAREADTKRAVVEKRRYDRRQQWAEKRRYQQRQDQELRDVEQKVREETEPSQALAAQPAKLEMPRIRVFEAE